MFDDKIRFSHESVQSTIYRRIFEFYSYFIAERNGLEANSCKDELFGTNFERGKIVESS